MIKKKLQILFIILFLGNCTYIRLMGVGGGRISVIKSYKFVEYSKKEINESIKCVYNDFPEFKAPEYIDSQLLVYKYASEGSELRNRWNADSVKFYFHIISQSDTLLLWTSFSGLMNNWNKKYSYLDIDGFSINNSVWKRQGSKGSKKNKYLERKRAIKIFELEILPKIKRNLKQ